MDANEHDTPEPVSGHEVSLVTGGAGHQLNNMLQAIIGHAELVSGQGVDGPERGAAARAIRRIATNASRIVEKMIRLARKGRHPVRVELSEQVFSAVEDLRRALPVGFELELHTEAERFPVQLEPRHMHLLLEHLVTNARDAMPRGGRISVSLRRDGTRAVLEVADTGQGLDPEVRVHFFEPFFSTRPNSAGLGLTMVHEIVQEAGGDIAISSELGRGTTVHIELPIVAAIAFRPQRRVVPMPDPAPDAQPPRGHGQTVLLAEDDEGVSSVLEAQLEHLGYMVRTATSGEAARELVASGAVRPDVLLTDLMMPGMGGFKLAETLRAARPDLPVIYMTGLTSDAIAARAVEQPNTEFLTKPFPLATLADRLAALLPDR